MGLYFIDCSTCKKSFQWFSGCLDQRCSACQNIPKENKGESKKMTKKELEIKLLDLEKKIAVLEARPQFCTGHYCHCNSHNYPYASTISVYPYYGGTWYRTDVITTMPITSPNSIVS